MTYSDFKLDINAFGCNNFGYQNNLVTRNIFMLTALKFIKCDAISFSKYIPCNASQCSIQYTCTYISE